MGPWHPEAHTRVARCNSCTSSTSSSPLVVAFCSLHSCSGHLASPQFQLRLVRTSSPWELVQPLTNAQRCEAASCQNIYTMELVPLFVASMPQGGQKKGSKKGQKRVIFGQKKIISKRSPRVIACKNRPNLSILARDWRCRAIQTLTLSGTR
jgi:hypothetical protein